MTFAMGVLALMIVAPSVSGVLHGGQKSQERACEASDLEHRSQLQNKLGGLCEEMCKEVGSYPKCPQCAGFVPPDPTPGVMTWEELLVHMDNLSDWGHDELKSWTKTASQLQNKLAGLCEEMCKEVGSYPKCPQCAGFVPPDP